MRLALRWHVFVLEWTVNKPGLVRRWIDGVRWRIIWRLLTDDELNMLHEAAYRLERDERERKVRERHYAVTSDWTFGAWHMVNKLRYGRTHDPFAQKVTEADRRREKRIAH